MGYKHADLLNYAKTKLIMKDAPSVKKATKFSELTPTKQKIVRESYKKFIAKQKGKAPKPAKKPAPKAKKSTGKRTYYFGPVEAIDSEERDDMESYYIEEGWEVYRREGNNIWLRKTMTPKQAKEEVISDKGFSTTMIGNEQSYQQSAKGVFDLHKRAFGHDHYAQVFIRGYGNLNWDGYNLYDKELFGRGKKVGTYENKARLSEWARFGAAQAFTKHDPLELRQSAKGLKLS